MRRRDVYYVTEMGKRWKHGYSRLPEYYSFRAMIDRCENPSNETYNRYGGRGITVCERWHDFEAFCQDMGPRPFKGASIDRIDNDGPYSPENCRWASPSEQCRNRRTNIMVEYQGETLCVMDWAKRMNIKYHSLLRRLQAGWDVDDAMTRPIKRGID